MEIQRLEKALEDTGMKLSSVLSDSTGVSARRILDALVAGERDPQTLAELVVAKIRHKIPLLAEALEGTSSNPQRLDECSAERTAGGHCKPTGHTGRTRPIANADCVIGPRSHQPERIQVTPGWDMPTQVSGGVGTLLIAPS